MCRCPVCNPIHRVGNLVVNGVPSRNGNKRYRVPTNMIVFPKTRRLREKNPCAFCKGTKLVTVELAEKYLAALRNPSEQTVRFSHSSRNTYLEERAGLGPVTR